MNSVKKHHALRRSAIAAVASTALLLGSTLAATPARAEPGDGMGRLTVNVLDSQGRPLPASIMGTTVDGASGFTFPLPGESESMAVPKATYTAEVETGRYGFVVSTPWGGLLCAGISPCTPMAPESAIPTVTGVVDVTDDGPAAVYTVRFPAPAVITGSREIGGVLKATLSPQQQAAAQSIAGLPMPGGSTGLTLSMQWLRNGVAIPGATSATYRLTAADANRRIDIALSYPELMRVYLGMMGFSTAPYVVPGVTAGKAATRTTAALLRKRVVAGRGAVVRADVTVGRAPVNGGKVRFTIGKKKVTKAVRNGTARTVLPRNLKPGMYRITVKYLGSATFQASKARTQKLRVVQK